MKVEVKNSEFTQLVKDKQGQQFHMELRVNRPIGGVVHKGRNYLLVTFPRTISIMKPFYIDGVGNGW